jgi:glycosyltransferase involved in cell wall biosynthesis
MKLLYLNASSQLGGAERNLIDTICAVQDRDPSIEIAVLITAADGPIMAELDRLGIKIVLLELPSKIAQLGDSGLKGQNNRLVSILSFARNISLLGEFISYWQQLKRSIWEIDPDVIHSNGMKTHLLAASLGISTPIIWHLHDFIGSRVLVKQLLKLFVNRASAAIAISQSIADDWQAVFPSLHIELIYNAIDVDRYKPQLSIRDSQHLNIGLVATYALWKGHDLFIQAIGHIAKKRPELQSTVKFYIIGGAIYETTRSQYSRSQLQQLARDLNVEDWLVFIDFQQDIVSAYNMLDIVVHASTQPEPFGRTIVEAMACEKAVIVAQAGGAAELFTHQKDAIGVLPGNSTALSAAIEQLIDSPTNRIALGKAARITVKDRFNRDRLGKDLLSLYQKIAIDEFSDD